jgi:hypothetical protein
MLMGAYCPLSSLEDCREGEGEGCLASLVNFTSCLLPVHASPVAAPILIQQLHVCFQLSCYSIVLLAVARTRAAPPMRHQPEDKRP